MFLPNFECYLVVNVESQDILQIFVRTPTLEYYILLYFFFSFIKATYTTSMYYVVSLHCAGAASGCYLCTSATVLPFSAFREAYNPPTLANVTHGSF